MIAIDASHSGGGGHVPWAIQGVVVVDTWCGGEDGENKDKGQGTWRNFEVSVCACVCAHDYISILDY